MKKNNLKLKLKQLLLLLIWVISPEKTTEDSNQPSEREKAAMEDLNQKVEEKAGRGKFEFDENGFLIFTGGATPLWAIDEMVQKIGFDPRYGTGGIDPFQAYTHKEWKETDDYAYAIGELGFQDVWDRNIGRDNKASGIDLLLHRKQKDGVDFYKNYTESVKKRGERRRWLRDWTREVIPQMTQALRNSKTLTLGVAIILIVIGLPTILWHGSKKFFAWVFVKRPTILGPSDTDIYGNIFYRLFWRFPVFPKVIVNDELQKELEALKQANKAVSLQNKLKRNSAKYSHVLAYGPAGVGKTLFAKSLAKASKMHFIYMTVSDLSQLGEEEALQELKAFFRYARRHGPTLLIVDEADRLFAGEDLKSKKLALSFQREFAKSVDAKVQLFCITNFPNKFPSPILNRMGKKIQFTKPDFQTQIRLLGSHLDRVFKLRGKNAAVLKGFQDQLDEKLLKGLVGRDFESIAEEVANKKNPVIYDLKIEIKKRQESRRGMKKFRLEDEVEPEKPVKKSWL